MIRSIRPRRAFSVALTLGVLAFALAAGPVAARGAPERFFLPADDLHFAAGEVCDFPLTQEVVVNRAYGILFPVAADGSQELHVSGALVLREINDATGASMLVNASGPGKLTSNADGSTDVVGSGRWTLFFFPTDADGPSMHLSVGHFEVRIEADGVESIVVFPNHTLDICAALAA